jgi:DNA-binding protein HU-beta
MNKTELIAAVADKAGISKKDADSAVNATIDAVIASVAKEERVQIVGFGTFELHNRSARQGRDPRTNKPITIPASRVPAFKAGKAFKDAVAKK